MIDLTHRCPLACSKCQRQEYFTDLGKTVPGIDIPLSTLDKVLAKFEHVCFGGQLSDPIHHPKFIEILEMCADKKVGVKVQTASSAKSESWYKKAWQANPNAKWQFGIDGLPEESFKYRVNQDGIKLFNIMCEAKQYLNTQPIWQCIIFAFNETHLDKVKDLAEQNSLKLLFLHSSRWAPIYDPLRPLNPEWSID